MPGSGIGEQVGPEGGGGTSAAAGIISGQKLATQVYAPGSASNKSLNNGTLTALDTTNCTLAYTVPASGKVDIEVEFWAQLSETTNATLVQFCLFTHNTTTQIGNTHVAQYDNIPSDVFGVLVRSTFVLTGQAVGAAQLDLAACIASASGGSGFVICQGISGALGATSQGSEFIMRAFAG